MDFILTLSDEEDDAAKTEDVVAEPTTSSTSSSTKRKRASKDSSTNKKAKLDESDVESIASDMASDFEFQVDGDLQDLQNFDAWESDMTQLKDSSGSKKGVDIDELLSKRRSAVIPVQDEPNSWNGFDDESLANGDAHDDTDDELLAEDGFGMGAPLDNQDEDGDGSGDDGDHRGEDEDSSDQGSGKPSQSHLRDQDMAEDSASSDDDEEKAKATKFFAAGKKHDSGSVAQSFLSMHISRPILRGLAAMQFSEPTPIQAKTIPIALLGEDIVGSAVTGSGKTGAFMIPILDRLLFRSKKVPTSRVVILLPTRELAVQCFNVGKKLASFTDITFCQLVGGFSLREQEQALKQRPDIIIATPGRFIDHMRNSASLTVDTLEILVLDEADRMLEDGFADELNEILTTIPKSRQTMLFSATMTSSIDRLISIGLNKPVRVMVDAKKQTVNTLTQEFLRLRPGREDSRLAYLLHLCQEVFTDRCIIFFRQKKEAHRARVIFALFGFKAAELHGNITQEQRMASVEKFRSGAVSHLLATDVAARGLDIKGVESVINYEAPQSHEIYLHRVGRTARAGRSGKACTFAAESDRKVVKAAVKAARAQGAKIVSRSVEAHLVDAWIKKLENVDAEVDEILEEEKELKELASAQMQVKKGENMIDHEDEILSRPKRTWFASEKDKKAAKRKDEAGTSSASGKKFKRKLSGKEKKKMDAKKDRAEGRVSRGKTRNERLR